MAGLHQALIFEAALPNTLVREYSLAEYLAWRQTCGISVPEGEIAGLITWLQAKDNNLGRLACYISVLEFRKAYPGHPDCIAFSEYERRKLATLRGQ